MTENGNFFEGDEVLIRFRLFADQLAHGWGWAIDNLSIQRDAVTSVEIPQERLFELYPVPADSKITVRYDPHGDMTPIQISITDAVGRELHSTTVSPDGKLFEHTIDVAHLKDGFYILRAKIDSKVIKKKFVKRQQ
jgi:hypothetical protein